MYSITLCINRASSNRQLDVSTSRTVQLETELSELLNKHSLHPSLEKPLMNLIKEHNDLDNTQLHDRTDTNLMISAALGDGNRVNRHDVPIDETVETRRPNAVETVAFNTIGSNISSDSLSNVIIYILF